MQYLVFIINLMISFNSYNFFNCKIFKFTSLLFSVKSCFLPLNYNMSLFTHIHIPTLCILLMLYIFLFPLKLNNTNRQKKRKQTSITKQGWKILY